MAGQGFAPPPMAGGVAPPPMAGGVAPPPLAGQPQMITPQAQAHAAAKPPPAMFDPGTAKTAPAAGSAAAPAAPANNAAKGTPKSANNKSRIDPAQIPRPKMSMEEEATRKLQKPKNEVIDTDSLAMSALPEDANAAPGFMRMTFNQIGSEASVASGTAVPLGLIIRPLAPFGMAEEKVGLVNGQTTSGVMRCSKCRAYVNPFMRFTDNGHKVVCNFCGNVDPVPTEYFCGLDADGRRYDVAERPELRCGSVEFIAPAEFTNRHPQGPIYLFVLDVSFYAVSSNLLPMWVEAIREVLAGLPQDPRIQIGFVTYDKTVHFWHTKSGSAMLRMTVAHQLDGVAVPTPSGIMTNLVEQRETVNTILQTIAETHATDPVGEACVGAAMEAASSVLQATGGKLMLFQASIPTVGPGKGKPRDEVRLYGTDKEKTLYQPQDPFWRRLGMACVQRLVACDIFCYAQKPLELPSVSIVSKLTGGQIYFNNQAKPEDKQTLIMNLRRNMSRNQGWEAVMRVRCSENLSISDYYGNFSMQNDTDMDIVSLDCDKAMAVQFKYEGKLPKYVSFQVALLYTNMNGERRIRVHTQCLTTTSQLSNVFRGADVDAIVNFSLRQSLQACLTSTVQSARDALIKRCVNTLHVYRKSCATSSSLAQLILPESLKLLPLYTLGLLKTNLLRKASEVRSDERAFLMAAFNSMPIKMVMKYVFPTLLPLHNMEPECGLIGEGNEICLPTQISASSEQLDGTGLYLLDTGMSLYIWVGRHCPPDMLLDVFGCMFDDISSQLPVLNTELNQKINAVTTQVQNMGGYWRPCEVMKQRHPGESKVYAHLIEDKSAPGYNMSYVEFLCHVHSQIQAKMR